MDPRHIINRKEYLITLDPGTKSIHSIYHKKTRRTVTVGQSVHSVKHPTVGSDILGTVKYLHMPNKLREEDFIMVKFENCPKEIASTFDELNIKDQKI